MNSKNTKRMVELVFRSTSIIIALLLFTPYTVSSEINIANVSRSDTDLGRERGGGVGHAAANGRVAGEPALTAPGPGQISVDGLLYNDLSTAASVIKEGSVVFFGSGIYRHGLVIRHDAVTLLGSVGTHFKGAATKGMATFVVDGDNVVIENIECSAVAVPHKNGACVRQNGRDLTLRYVHFHDSQQGILSAKGSGKLTIENSRFERLGNIGRAHAVYSNNASLEIRNSRFLSSKGEGHEIKSRAPMTLIESSVVASLTGKDSRLVDISNGGTLIVRNSVLQQGANSSNFQLLGFGLEGMKGRSPQSVILENNTIIAEHNRGNVLLGLPTDSSSISISIIDNDIIGGNKLFDIDKHNILDNNKVFISRFSYGLGAFPDLPELEGLDTP